MYCDFTIATEEKATTLKQQTLDCRRKDKYPRERDTAKKITEKVVEVL